jgi:penicillin-binding protein 1A
VTTAWIGFDQPAPLGRGEVGGRTALPMWVDYMRVALAGVPEKPLLRPPGIVTAYVHRETGRLSDASDPEAIPEYFVPGTVPSATGGIDGAVPGEAPPENIREGLF